MYKFTNKVVSYITTPNFPIPLHMGEKYQGVLYSLPMLYTTQLYILPNSLVFDSLRLF